MILNNSVIKADILW